MRHSQLSLNGGLTRHQVNRVSRRGVTFGEVFLAALAVLLVMALLLPRIGPRPSSRRVECIDHQKNIALAIHNYATRHQGRIPPLRGPSSIEDDADPLTSPLPLPWTIAILPEMDCRALYDRLLAVDVRTNAGQEPMETFPVLAQQMVRGYTCPDSTQHATRGALSYVANAGYMTTADWTDSVTNTTGPNVGRILWKFPLEDLQSAKGPTLLASKPQTVVSMATAAFIDPRVTDGGDLYTGYAKSLDSILDGLSSTLLLTENLNSIRWAGTDLISLGFGIPIEVDHGVPRFVGNGTEDGALTFQPRFTIGQSGINTLRDQNRLARPSSNHPGGVVAAFCDGRVAFLSDEIDERVYAEIITPSGSRYGQGIVTPKDLSF